MESVRFGIMDAGLNALPDGYSAVSSGKSFPTIAMFPAGASHKNQIWYKDEDLDVSGNKLGEL